ncbi:MAG: cytochrome c biogenesis protein ResB [Alphaproteobacteria bacterium]|nr:cytochrome c biogenesis protein ResB [Alphaproteobacteria bacterium]
MQAPQSLIQNLARPAIVFYTLPALMALLIVGTLVQGHIGIYEAQKQYFASFILWVGPEGFQIPLPGGFALLGFIALNLTLKFILYSEWRWDKAGIILAHLGALTLLIGGLLTALFAREGYMALTEGQTSPFVYDYHAREFSIFRDDGATFKVPFTDLAENKAIPLPDAPFSITPLSLCRSCAITMRAETAQDFMKGTPKDLAEKMALSTTAPDKDDEKNLAGITFAIEGAGGDQDGSYIAFEAMPRPVVIAAGEHEYKIILGKAQRLLPFALSLQDFRKTDHPGTAMARAYESDVRVEDGALKWEAEISMNAPLRYRGYTFYQSSFDTDADGKNISVLSVVENKGGWCLISARSSSPRG